MKKWIVIAFVLVFGVLMFHKALLLASCKFVLYRAQHSLVEGTVSYQKMGWEEGKIVVRDLVIQDKGQEILVDEVSLCFAIDWRHLSFCPHIEVLHPQVLMEEKKAGSSPFFLYRSKRFAPVWSIRNGVLQAGSHRFYFTFLPEEKKRCLGSLVVKADLEQDTAPLVRADFFEKERDVFVEFEVKERDLYRSYPLISAFVPGIDHLAGSIEIEGSLLLGKEGNCQDLTLHSKLDRVFCALPRVDLFVENVNGRLDLFFVAEEEQRIELMVQVAGELRQGDFLLPWEVESEAALGKREPFSWEGSLSIQHPDKKKAISAFQCVWDGNETYTLGVQAQNWTTIELNRLLRSIGLKSECVEGNLNGDFTLTFSKEGIYRLAVQDVKAKGLRMYDESHKMLFLQEMEASALIDPRQEEWLQEFCIKGEKGEYVDPTVHISEISFAIAKDNNGFVPSFFQGDWKELSLHLSYLGAEVESPWQVIAKGDLSPLLAQILPGKVKGKTPFEVQVQAARSQDSIHCLYEGSLFLDRFVASSVLKWADFSLYDVFAGQVPFPSFEQGNVQFSSCNLSSYQPLLEELFPKLALGGIVQAQASFTKDLFEMQFTGHDFGMTWEGMSFSLSKIAKASVCYETKSRLLSYEIPLDALSLHMSNAEVAIQGIRADLQGSSDLSGQGGWVHKGTLSHLRAPLSGGSSLYEGKIEWRHSAKEFFVAKGEGKWSQESGKEFGWELKKLFWELGEKRQGEFCCRLLEEKKEMALLDGIIKEKTPYSWECTLHKEKSHVADVVLQAEPLYISLEGVNSFEIRPLISLEKLPSLLQLIQNMGFFADLDNFQMIESLALQGKVQTGISWHKASGEWKIMALSSSVSMRKQEAYPFRLESKFSKEKWAIDSLEIGGISIQAELSSLLHGMMQISRLEGSWQGVSFQGKGDVRVEGKKAFCSLPSLQCAFGQDNVSGQVAASVEFGLDFSKEEGEIVTGETHFVSHLTKPVVCVLSTPRMIRFSYGIKEGFICEGIRLVGKEGGSNSYWGEWSAKKLGIFSSGQIVLEGMEGIVTPLFAKALVQASLVSPDFSSITWDGNLRVSGDFKWQKNGYGFQGFLSPGWYGWQDRKLFLEQVQLFFDPQGLLIRTKTHVEEEPLWASLQLKFGKEMYGLLKILDHPQSPGLQLTFRSSSRDTYIETVEGSACGLQCHLIREEKKKVPGRRALSGEISWDMQRLQLLMSKQLQEKVSKWKMGSGLRWKGEVLYSSDGKLSYAFRGRLQGNDFAFLGYEFREMTGDLEGNSEKIILSDLQIREGNASILMPACCLKKESEEWKVEIPSIEVQKLQPSALRRTDGARGSYKPFVIKHFTLRRVQGVLNEPNSWKGEGSLAFLNQSKKESSLFDLPLEMIKKLGLDLGVVTPVEGEFTLQLAGEKLYFLSLDRAFSEARRSEFYLAPSEEPSYIDLSGNLHIDLRMHQNALFKVVEPFTLTVRGTLEKPRYGLSL